VSGQHHAPAAFYPGERAPGTHCIGGWVGPRDQKKNAIFSESQETNTELPVSLHAKSTFGFYLLKSSFPDLFFFSHFLSCFLSFFYTFFQLNRLTTLFV
jgi:hypothetical protein